MTKNLVCWEQAAVQFATQVDVGGLEVGDDHADAVFAAIHQPIPINQVRDLGNATTSESKVTEDIVLKRFCSPIAGNEPLLLFVTGQKGTGKSHLVRWLRSRIGPRPDWHVVYVEKRNTDLRRVTEKILLGIDTPKATQLREDLARAGSVVSSDEEAMSALLERLSQLVRFDTSSTIPGLAGLDESEIDDLRRMGSRLLGDYTFREELSRSDGPIHRIVKLARGGPDPGAELDEADLRLSAVDLKVDPARFEDVGSEMAGLIRSLVSTEGLRSDLAALCDFYLPRAKAQVFTGQGTDLLEVFEDVRREIAARGQELCLFVEDLVLLHGIDKQLAQALTVPATKELCKLRAAIAVTDGYLRSLDTFTDRGIRFTLDMNLDTVGASGMREFVGRYLNVARLSEADLAGAVATKGGVASANGCRTCPQRKPCHETFGTTSAGHGLYPFNAAAVDRMVRLASPEGFRPREILRTVLREPLETAENELPSGQFPSEEFAHTLDEMRSNLSAALRRSVRHTSANPDAELSLRAFYAARPPAIDDEVRAVAQYFGVKLTDLDVDTVAPEEPVAVDAPSRSESAGQDEFDRWALGTRMAAPTALAIRKYLADALIARLRSGPYGLTVTGDKANSWWIGSHLFRTTDIEIENAAGKSALEASYPLRFLTNDDNAVLLRGVFATAQGGDPMQVDNGAWMFQVNTRLDQYAEDLADLARTREAAQFDAAVAALAVLRHAHPEPGQTVDAALGAIFAPQAAKGAHPALAKLAIGTRDLRETALGTLRTYATTAKGSGKPSVLDAALVQPILKSHLNLRTLPEPGADLAPDWVASVTRARTAQAGAANDAWRQVGDAVAAVAAYLSPDEDLDQAMGLLPRLVQVAANGGKLSGADSKARFEAALVAVPATAMETYRRMAKRLDAGVGAGDVWDLREDPVPHLQALAAFARESAAILTSLENSTSVVAAGRDLDTHAVIAQLRVLSDILDGIAK
jgi:hypothetical protein